MTKLMLVLWYWMRKRSATPSKFYKVPLSWQQECEEWDREHPNGVEND